MATAGTPTTESSPTDAESAESKSSIWWIFSGLMLGMVLASLDQTIVATALPTIAGDLNGLNHLSWVVTAYLLASTVATPLWGKLGDQFGRKNFFLAAIVIFLVGSALAGLSSSMNELIGFRALQGLGGGGLMIGAQAIIADVVSPRDRGRYQGYFGAVFGVSSVAGPLLGGFFVDNLSWHWVFYVNVPIGLIALVVIAFVLKTPTEKIPHKIDYTGSALLAAGVTCLVLLTTWGGSQYAWLSTEVIGLAIAAAVLLTALIFVERNAVEPVLPLSLFSGRIFSVSCAVGFAVGFALFGVVTYLPLFLQVAQGASPTASGLQLLPLMAGVLTTSVASGQLISKYGKYKIFPIVGTATMAVGLFLLSFVTASTSLFAMSIYMGILGLGLGCVLQVLVLAVQNSVDPADLGAATSATTFFRSIGGSFGVALFGAIFNSGLARNLDNELPAGQARTQLESLGSQVDAKQLAQLPANTQTAYITAFVDSLSTVFLWAVPFALAGFLLSFLLKEIPLRDANDATAADPGAVSTDGVDDRLGAAHHASGVHHSLENVGVAFGLDPSGRTAALELARARIRGIYAALDRLDELSSENGLSAAHTQALRWRYERRLTELRERSDSLYTVGANAMPAEFWATVGSLIAAERQELQTLADADRLTPAVHRRADSDLAAESTATGS